jgi:hypothetical protein
MGDLQMWYQIQSTISKAQQSLPHMDREHWIAVFVIAVIVGCFCMRGFGSRTGY